MTNRVEYIYERFAEAGFRVSTDTRKIEPGSLFFALKGDNFNGNLFAASALEKGASYAIVDEKQGDNDRLILVDNALTCLQELAGLHRTRLNTPVLGIGGSNGKTTTKELIVSVLSTQLNTHYTKGNLNNHIGVPLTLLQLRPEHEVAVIELGANKTGDIHELCMIARPSLGIITNIGKEHLEGFGGMEGVAKAESELFDFLLQHNGHAFVNMDDQWLVPMGVGLTNKTLYSMKLEGVKDLNTVPSISFNYRGTAIHSVLMGDHNYQNIIAAIVIGNHFGIAVSDIEKGVASYVPSNNRSQIIKTEKGNTVWLDAYNANPSSVEMAVRTFEKMQGDKIILLGDMFELGSYEQQEHQAITSLCAEADINECYLIGEAFDRVETGKSQVMKFRTKEEALPVIRQKAYNGSFILIKGSRGMKMEEFLNEF